ncbi:MAG: hypothetical protein ACJ8C4_07425 [Gemmataceae bacterium]
MDAGGINGELGPDPGFDPMTPSHPRRHPPLFVPRPIVEPEQFAALRPPSYAGPASNFLGGALGFQGSNIGINGAAGGGLNLGNYGGALGVGGAGGYGGQQYLGGASGFGGGAPVVPTNRYARPSMATLLQQQASLVQDEAPTIDPSLPAYEKYKRRLLDQRGKKETAESPLRVTSEVTEIPLGEPARYTLSQTLKIPRLKSALVPFVNETITAKPISVYSPDIHETRALQAYRIKNTTGKSWVAGPISVGRADGYAGDARLTDWPVDEERIVAFALDSGCECQRSMKDEPEETVGVKIDHGQLEVTQRMRAHTQYNFRHHGGPDRALWVEHQAEAHWKVVQPAKADERTKDRFRFKVELTAGKTSSLEVVLERKVPVRYEVSKADDATLKALAFLTVTPAAVKQAIGEVLAVRERLHQTGVRLAEARAALADAGEEQARVRTNLERVPNGSSNQKDLLEKLSRYETAIDAARQKIVAATNEEKAIKEELRAKTGGLTAS